MLCTMGSVSTRRQTWNTSEKQLEFIVTAQKLNLALLDVNKKKKKNSRRHDFNFYLYFILVPNSTLTRFQPAQKRCVVNFSDTVLHLLFHCFSSGTSPSIQIHQVYFFIIFVFVFFKAGLKGLLTAIC